MKNVFNELPTHTHTLTYNLFLSYMREGFFPLLLWKKITEFKKYLYFLFIFLKNLGIFVSHGGKHLS